MALLDRGGGRGQWPGGSPVWCWHRPAQHTDHAESIHVHVVNDTGFVCKALGPFATPNRLDHTPYLQPWFEQLTGAKARSLVCSVVAKQ